MEFDHTYLKVDDYCSFLHSEKFTQKLDGSYLPIWNVFENWMLLVIQKYNVFDEFLAHLVKAAIKPSCCEVSHQKFHFLRRYV